MECVAEVSGRHLAALNIVAVALVDDNAITDFHNATLYALKLIASTGHLDKQEEIYHGVAGCLALSHTHSLYENLVETGSLAEHDGFPRLTGYTAQGTG